MQIGPYSAPRPVANEDSPKVQCTKDETVGRRCFSISHLPHGVSYDKNIYLFTYLFIYCLFNDTVNNSTPGTEPATVKQVYASDLRLSYVTRDTLESKV